MKSEEIHLSKLDKILSNYKGQEGALLPVLREVQAEFGRIPPEAIDGIADALKLFSSQVHGVATFYSFLSIKPQGKNIIRICKSMPCFLKNSQTIIESVEKGIGIKPGEATPDGKFCFQLTNCIGVCDKAPAMMINNEVYVDLTPSKISQILKTYK